ncbi:MAG TPA: hypothetical protein VF163_13035 [Micromonosporaceae bacterium]
MLMVLIAPRSAQLVEARGARFTLLVGYAVVLLGFRTMLLVGQENIPYWRVGSPTRSSAPGSGSPERQRPTPSRARRPPRSATPSARRRSSPAPKASFLYGDQWAYLAGIAAVLLGAALVYFAVAKQWQERADLAGYRTQGAGSAAEDRRPIGHRGWFLH